MKHEHLLDAKELFMECRELVSARREKFRCDAIYLTSAVACPRRS